MYIGKDIYENKKGKKKIFYYKYFVFKNAVPRSENSNNFAKRPADRFQPKLMHTKI